MTVFFIFLYMELISLFRFSVFSECWSEKPEDRPTFQWICAAVKRLMKDQKVIMKLTRSIAMSI